MNIAFDLDEVLCGLIDAVLPHVKEKTGVELTIDVIKEFDVYGNKWHEDTIMNRRVSESLLFAFGNETVMSSAKPLEGAIDLLNWVKNQGHTIFIATAREPDQLKLTTDWLEKYNFKFDDVACTGIGNKAAYAKRLDLSYFVDDCVGNLQDVYAEGACPHKGAMLMNKPWNIDACLEMPFIRVDNCKEIKEYIEDTI